MLWNNAGCLPNSKLASRGLFSPDWDDLRVETVSIFEFFLAYLDNSWLFFDDYSTSFCQFLDHFYNDFPIFIWLSVFLWHFSNKFLSISGVFLDNCWLLLTVLRPVSVDLRTFFAYFPGYLDCFRAFFDNFPNFLSRFPGYFCRFYVCRMLSKTCTLQVSAKACTQTCAS